jgi:hypothetical protein
LFLSWAKLSAVFSVLLFGECIAQPIRVYEGEVGFSLGAAHYYGDLNNKPTFNRPKVNIGVFYRKQVSDYIGIRIGLHYARLGYSDKYSNNEFQQRRNLSFNTAIWEIALQGDFNFFRFEPSNPDYRFTPYITLGAGLFNYDPPPPRGRNTSSGHSGRRAREVKLVSDRRALWLYCNLFSNRRV